MGEVAEAEAQAGGLEVAVGEEGGGVGGGSPSGYPVGPFQAPPFVPCRGDH